MLIVPHYAAILALVFILLSFRTIRLRRRMRVGIGDAGSLELQRAIGVHSNFAEYTPLALILFTFLEIMGARTIYIHFLCSAFLLGRCLHAYGVSQIKENLRFRVSGMMLTLTSTTFAAIALLCSWMWR